VRSALQEGIITGGGLALYRAGIELSYKKFEKTIDEKVAAEILIEAIKVPMEQIIINAGKDVEEIIITLNGLSSSYGYDVKNEKIGDMYKMGIIDPLKVTKSALINAVSVATTILSTNAIITHARA
tara:strand:+ start:28 stop:405 length:378 start_codon:yes stop_codon:yes gene_type:complete